MRVRQIVSLALLATYLPACTSFEATTTPLPEVLAPPKPAKELKVWTKDGRHLTLKAPRIRNDSLFGTEGGKTTDEQAVAVPFAEIAQVEAPKVDGTKTTILVVGSAAVLALWVVALSSAMDWEAPDLGGAFAD